MANQERIFTFEDGVSTFRAYELKERSGLKFQIDDDEEGPSSIALPRGKVFEMNRAVDAWLKDTTPQEGDEAPRNEELVEQLKRELKALNDALQRKHEELGVKAQQIADLNVALEGTRAENSKLRGDYSALESRTTREIWDTKAALNTANEELEKSRSQYDELHTKFTNLSAMHDRLRQQQAIDVTEAVAAKETRDTAVKMHGELGTKYRDLKTKYAEACGQRELFKQELEQVRVDNERRADMVQESVLNRIKVRRDQLNRRKATAEELEMFEVWASGMTDALLHVRVMHRLPSTIRLQEEMSGHFNELLQAELDKHEEAVLGDLSKPKSPAEIIERRAPGFLHVVTDDERADKPVQNPSPQTVPVMAYEDLPESVQERFALIASGQRYDAGAMTKLVTALYDAALNWYNHWRSESLHGTILTQYYQQAETARLVEICADLNTIRAAWLKNDVGNKLDITAKRYR